MSGGIRLLALVTVFSTILCSTWHVKAAPFSGGIMVERVGGDANFAGAGGAAVSGTAASIFLDEFSLASGNRLQTIALPDTDPDGAGAQHRITENANQNQTG